MADRQHGFTYLVMLFFVALTAAGLAALGQSWSNAAEREREAELVFRGNEIARAIANYAAASPNPAAPQYPRSLEDLLVDQRGLKTRYHLRRIYRDPFTNAADWELIPVSEGSDRFNAIRSRSVHPLLRAFKDDGSPVKKAKDWAFSGVPELMAAAPAASAASAASSP
ncbi:type II secretion system protein [Paucibacter sp. R3-3]|uniref:Type II secretion system protein n=1 Tax=Roseateles agri TaxID=3098619 RepID=A0ABU5DR92_9BURK|nr:type II secretion system protein [Paucibacter sp. R3-3]MDY0748838.1 type II secretion system protein [Paucibacter sp. R3-3]